MKLFSDKMTTGTRLILILTLIVGAVMLAASYIMLRERERGLQVAMKDELHAHALTLRYALETSFAENHFASSQKLINRLRDNTDIYAVVVFDETGAVQMLSNTVIADEIRRPSELATVLERGVTISIARHVAIAHTPSGVTKQQPMLSIIMPLQLSDNRRGALEIVQSLGYIEAESGRAQRSWLLATVALLIAVSGVVAVVLRRAVSRPVAELLTGAVAVGQGDLSYRVVVPPDGGEFHRLAREFNRMADSLSEQRTLAQQSAEERLELERALRHHERLAAVGRLAAGVAHELGTPLNVIDTRAEQLLNKPKASLEVRVRNLDIIRKQTRRITHIVRQLLNLARPYNLRATEVALRELVRESIEAIEFKRHHIKVEVCADSKSITGDGAATFRQPDEREVKVCVDADFARQVIINILTNAMQAMPDGGTVNIVYQACAARRDDQTFALVSISDTGGGIADEHRAHIFEPFYTTKDVGNGTGLGLAVAYRIVEEHGGWMTAENNLHGATFKVYLPQVGSSD